MTESDVTPRNTLLTWPAEASLRALTKVYIVTTLNNAANIVGFKIGNADNFILGRALRMITGMSRAEGRVKATETTLVEAILDDDLRRIAEIELSNTNPREYHNPLVPLTLFMPTTTIHPTNIMMIPKY